MVTFYRPLSTESNSIMPQLWIERERERERGTDGKTDIHSIFNIFSEIIHSVSLIFRDMWLEGCWSSSSVLFVSFFCFLFLSFFSSKMCFFLGLSWRRGSGVLIYLFLFLFFSRNMFSQTPTLLLDQSLLHSGLFSV